MTFVNFAFIRGWMCVLDGAVMCFIQQLNDYELLKEALLHEFRISPVLLRERFLFLKKRYDETYSRLASELHCSVNILY